MKHDELVVVVSRGQAKSVQTLKMSPFSPIYFNLALSTGLKWTHCKSKIKTETLKLFINLTPDSFFFRSNVFVYRLQSFFVEWQQTTMDEINE